MADIAKKKKKSLATANQRHIMPIVSAPLRSVIVPIKKPHGVMEGILVRKDCLFFFYFYLWAHGNVSNAMG